MVIHHEAYTTASLTAVGPSKEFSWAVGTTVNRRRVHLLALYKHSLSDGALHVTLVQNEYPPPTRVKSYGGREG